MPFKVVRPQRTDLRLPTAPHASILLAGRLAESVVSGLGSHSSIAGPSRSVPHKGAHGPGGPYVSNLRNVYKEQGASSKCPLSQSSVYQSPPLLLLSHCNQPYKALLVFILDCLLCYFLALSQPFNTLLLYPYTTPRRLGIDAVRHDED